MHTTRRWQRVRGSDGLRLRPRKQAGELRGNPVEALTPPVALQRPPVESKHLLELLVSVSCCVVVHEPAHRLDRLGIDAGRLDQTHLVYGERLHKRPSAAKGARRERQLRGCQQRESAL